MEIGNRILELRKEKNLSQEQLAEQMGVARQTISKWELGETSPDLSQGRRLSQIFNVSLDELANNDIKDILITKVSNTERLAGLIIKIIKGIGIVLLVSLVGVIFVIACRKYFEATPNYMVADSYGVYCNIDGEKEYFEATTTREEPNRIDLHSTNEDILNAMQIDVTKYKSLKALIMDVKKYIKAHGGTCN